MPAREPPALIWIHPKVMVADLPTRFLLALLLTWLIELPVLFLLARVILRLPGVSNARLLAAGLVVSLLTLPVLWFVWPLLFPAGYSIWLGEGLVWLVEALLYRWLLRIRLSEALLISLLLNGLSFLVGLVVL